MDKQGAKNNIQDKLKEFEDGAYACCGGDYCKDFDQHNKDAKDFLQKALEDIYQKGKDEGYAEGKQDGVRGFVTTLRMNRIWETTKQIKVMAEQYLKNGGSGVVAKSNKLRLTFPIPEWAAEKYDTLIIEAEGGEKLDEVKFTPRWTDLKNGGKDEQFKKESV